MRQSVKEKVTYLEHSIATNSSCAVLKTDKKQSTTNKRIHADQLVREAVLVCAKVAVHQLFLQPCVGIV